MQKLMVRMDWLVCQLDQLKKTESVAADERQELRRIIAQLEEMDGRALAECRLDIKRYARRLDEIEGNIAGLRNAISRAMNAFEEAERQNKEEFEGKGMELPSGQKAGVSHSGSYREETTPMIPIIPGKEELHPIISGQKEGNLNALKHKKGDIGLGIIAFELFFELFDRWAQMTRWQRACLRFFNRHGGNRYLFQVNRRRIYGSIRKSSRILVMDAKALRDAPKDVRFFCSAKRLNVPDWLNERY
ncbi:MAG: hypothetical protein Q4G52_04600 [Clostridia bacterium]|nr:hypothetical protein [Clostridia bacterium]